jgi:hypothetical protein
MEDDTMTITIDITAAEREALRRALAGLVADERARFPGRIRRSRIEQAAESLYEKVFERKPHDGGAA